MITVVRRIVLITLALTAPEVARAASILSGTYLCKAGGSGMMLTLGELTVLGTSYRFHAPTGPDTHGTIQSLGDGFVWHGDIGAITNQQIVESKLDRMPNSFWFSYRARPTALPTTASCSL